MCFLVQGAAMLIGIAAVGVWIAAVLSFLAVWRSVDGPRSRLIFSSMWVLQAGSLGTAAEPHRRALAQRMGLFLLAVFLGIGTAVLGTATC